MRPLTLIPAALGFIFFVLPVSAQQPPSPCPCCDDAFRQFDFWVGDWEAFTGDKLAGTNRIVILQDSCVIQENWISANGNYTGTSYNFFDPQTKKWHQTWIDNQGGNLLLSGAMEGKSMVMYSGKMKDKEGNDHVNRITCTPTSEGGVRQLWEISSDDGKTWKAVFDGLYRRRE